MKNVNEEIKRLLAEAGIDLEQEKARIRKETEEEDFWEACIWNKLSEDDSDRLTKLIIRHERIDAIRFARSVADLGIIEARDFVDSPWLLQKVYPKS
jgi:ribosomal protein L7/L12